MSGLKKASGEQSKLRMKVRRKKSSGPDSSKTAYTIARPPGSDVVPATPKEYLKRCQSDTNFSTIFFQTGGLFSDIKPVSLLTALVERLVNKNKNKSVCAADAAVTTPPIPIATALLTKTLSPTSSSPSSPSSFSSSSSPLSSPSSPLSSPSTSSTSTPPHSPHSVTASPRPPPREDFSESTASISASTSFSSPSSSSATFTAEIDSLADEVTDPELLLSHWLASPWLLVEDQALYKAIEPLFAAKRLSSSIKEGLSKVRARMRHHQVVTSSPAITVAGVLAGMTLNNSTRELSALITECEWRLLSSIPSSMIVSPQLWKQPSEAPAPLAAYFRWFSDVQRWLVGELLLNRCAESRGRGIEVLITLGELLRKQRNFNGVMEVLAALCSPFVVNQVKAWRYVSVKSCRRFQRLTVLMSPTDNFAKLRKFTAEIKPSVPFLGLLLLDIVRFDSTIPLFQPPEHDEPLLHGHDNINNNERGVLVNIEKCRQISEVVRYLVLCLEHPSQPHIALPFLQESEAVIPSLQDLHDLAATSTSNTSNINTSSNENRAFPLAHFYASPPLTGFEFSLLTDVTLSLYDHAFIETYGHRRVFQAGELIASSQQPVEHLYLILKGAATIEQTRPFALSTEMHDYHWYGFTFERRCQNDLVTLVCARNDTEVCILPCRQIATMIHNHPHSLSFAQRFWRSLLCSYLVYVDSLSSSYDCQTQLKQLPVHPATVQKQTIPSSSSSSSSSSSPFIAQVAKRLSSGSGLARSSSNPESLTSSEDGDFLQSFGLTSFDARHLVKIATRETHAAGETLVKEGEVVQRIFILLSGVCSIYVSKGSTESFEVHSLTFGQSCITTGKPSKTSIVVASPTLEVLVIEAKDLNELCSKQPNLISRLYVFLLQSSSFFFSFPLASEIQGRVRSDPSLHQYQMLLSVAQELNESPNTARDSSPLRSERGLTPPLPADDHSSSSKSSSSGSSFPGYNIKAKRQEAVAALRAKETPQQQPQQQQQEEITSKDYIKSLDDLAKYFFAPDLNHRIITGLFLSSSSFPMPLEAVFGLLAESFEHRSAHARSPQRFRCFHLITRWFSLQPKLFAEGAPLALKLDEFLRRVVANCESTAEPLRSATLQQCQQLRALLEGGAPQEADSMRSIVLTQMSHVRTAPDAPCLWTQLFGMTWMDVDISSFARELTAVDHALISRILPTEILSKQTTGPLAGVIEFRRNVSRWVISTVLARPTVKERAAAITKVIELVRQLFSLHSFNTLNGVLTALGDQDLRRLTKTWEAVDRSSIKIWEEVALTLDRQHNFRLYYKHLRQVTSTGAAFIPLLEHVLHNGAYLSTRIQSGFHGKPSAVEVLRFEQLGGLAEIIERAQSTGYPFWSVDPVNRDLVRHLHPLWETPVIHKAAVHMASAESAE